jgi:hypothetical protein
MGAGWARARRACVYLPRLTRLPCFPARGEASQTGHPAVLINPNTKMTTNNALITDEQSLGGATSRFGHPIPVYDDGFGQLYIHRDSMGISGIVRAQTWEDAYSICEDEFFPAADKEAWEEGARINAMPLGDERDHAQACWEEAYGFRSNSRREKDGSTSSVYAKDLNGDRLELLTPEILRHLEITLQIEANA